jgi:hypothetical protein
MTWRNIVGPTYCRRHGMVSALRLWVFGVLVIPQRLYPADIHYPGQI